MKGSGFGDFLRALFAHKRVQPRNSLTGGRQEFAVIGLGRFGASVARTLVERGHTVLGIDSDKERVQALADEITQTVALDSTDEDALRQVDIAAYPTVVVAIGSQFEVNLMTTVALKALGVRNVICKAGTERQKTILTSVGADRVVLPEHDSGRRIAQELALPGIVDQISLTPNTRLSEVKCPAHFSGRSLRELRLAERFGVHVVAAARGSEITPVPRGDYVVTEEDLLVVIGEEADVARLLGE